MRTNFTIILTVFSFSLAYAQNHDYVWLFGYGSQNISTDWGGSKIDFNTNPPSLSYLFNEMNFDVTNGSICDINGELQFYTNGIYIANKFYQPMQNGNGINPGQYAVDHTENGYILDQGAFALPYPGGINKYYLVHADKKYPTSQIDWHCKFLYFSLIDMSQESGLGKVIEKNNVILNDTLGLGKLTAVRHANGRDWWMVVHEMYTGNYHRVLITSDGIDTVGMAATPFFIPQEGVGQSVFSPDGSVFVRMNTISSNFGQIFDIYYFDRCTGYLTERKQYHQNDGAYAAGVAISPNSRYLYISSDNYMYQFDLEAPDIYVTKKIIPYDGFIQEDFGFSTKFFLAQLAPDGKIYINSPSGVEYLHVIHQPNLPYPDCMVEQHGVTLPTYNAFSMPNFPNYRLGPLDGSPCDTLGLDNHPIAKYRYDQDTADYLSVRFTDLSYYEPAEWAWDFGDLSFSSEASPNHTFPGDGTYDVCLTVSNQYSSNTFCQTLVIGTGVSATGGAVGQQPEVSVFPNPAKEATNFILSGYLPRHAELRLFTATGQLALTQRIGFGWSMVGLEGIAPGLYFYEVKDNGRLLGSGKLVRVE